MTHSACTLSRVHQSVSFPCWRAALAGAPLPRGERSRFTTEIGRFLRYCEILDAPVTVARSREYLAIVPLPIARPTARRALRWYFKAGPRIGG